MHNHCTYTYTNDIGAVTSCMEDIINGSDFCVFHSPPGDEKDQTFGLKLRLYILALENNHTCLEYTLTGFIFPQYSFESFDFKKNIVFQNCTFTKKITFGHISFNGTVVFRNCRFEDTVAFEGTTFHSGISFIDSVFEKDTLFYNVTVAGSINLSGNDLSGLCSFNGVRFKTGGEFRNNNFQSSFSCAGLTCLAGLLFENNRFHSAFDASAGSYQDTLVFAGNTCRGSVDFHNAVFRDTVSMEKCEFCLTVYCTNAEFQNAIRFADCTFKDRVFFDSVKVEGNHETVRSCFSKSLDLSSTQFNGAYTHNNNIVLTHINFDSVFFNDTIEMSSSYFRYLHKVPVQNVCFDSSVIEELYAGNCDIFRGCSFKNTIILSLNLNGKEVTNCDFTGALLEGASINYWRPDSATLANTAYIFTEYLYRKVYNEDYDQYLPEFEHNPGSRVPFEGSFGTGEYAGFTLSDLFKKKIIFSRSIHIPVLVRTDVINYINYYTDYIRIVEGMAIELHFAYEGDNVRIDFKTNHIIDTDKVAKRLREYVEMLLLENLESIPLNLAENVMLSSDEIKMYETDIRSRIIFLRNELNKKMYAIHKSDILEVVSSLMRQLCTG